MSLLQIVLPLFLFITYVGVSKSEETDVKYSSSTNLLGGTLELVHVIFRHGDRTPDRPYPRDPYINETYEPVGLGQLTNDGKTRVYNIGLALRGQYGSFLGDILNPKLIEANTSPVDRCQNSLQIVLASLFPPNGANIWNQNLNWQPVPYKMTPQEENKIFLSIATCPSFFTNFFTYQASGGLNEAFEEYNDVMEYIHKNAGVPADPYSVQSLYATLKAEEEWGLSLPAWTETIWPEPLSTISARVTKEMFNLEGNRAIAAGFLMSKIVNDTKLLISNDRTVQGRKLYLYSGHESNIIAVLAWLGVLEEHNPNYGAYIVVEVYNFFGMRLLKILYENYEAASPVPVFIPGCGVYCPIEHFEELYSQLFNPYELCA